MAKGGAREGAGRPVGSFSPQNKKKIEFEKYLIEQIVKEKGPIIKALIGKAKEGEVKAITEALNRLLGKAKESVDVTTNGESVYSWNQYGAGDNLQSKTLDAKLPRKPKAVESDRRTSEMRENSSGD